MALVVLDASVVIAQLDARDPNHAAATGALADLAAEDLVLPASAYSECLVAPAGRGKLEQARSAIAELGVEITPIDEATAARAAELRAGVAALRLPDALVLAAGDVLQAEAVVTADARWRRFPRTRVLTS